MLYNVDEILTLFRMSPFLALLMATGVRSRDKHISGNSVLNCDGSERESFIVLKKAIFSSHPGEIRLRYLSPSYLKFHILRIPTHSSLLSVLRVSMQNK